MLLDDSLTRAARAQGGAAGPGVDVLPAGRAEGPGVAVVVCVHTPERLPLLRRGLAAVRPQLDRRRDELVIVVDGRPDLLAALRAELPGTAVLPNTGDRGLSGARNTGVAATSAPLIAFLDDDAIPTTDWIDSWRTVFADDAVVMVGGQVRPSWPTGRAPAWLPGELWWVVGCDYVGMPASGAVIRNPIGANMAVRRAALDAVGGFSANLGRVGARPTGCEETELGILVGRWAGPESVRRDCRPSVDHQVSDARTSVRYVLRRCWHEGRSKRRLADSVGAADGLSSERTYAIDVVRHGLAAHLGGVRRRDAMGPVRAVLLLLGMAVAGAGYLRGSFAGPAVRLPRSSDGHPASPTPTRVAVPPATDPVRRTVRPAVTAIVCTLGREPRLVGTVTALLNQTYPDLRVVVVDNDPRSGAADQLLTGIDDPRLTILREPRRGLSRARNAGLAAATGDLIAFTDDDARPAPAWIASLVDTFVAGDGRVGCVTGRVLAASRENRWAELFERFGSFDKGDTARVWSVDRGAERDCPLGVPGPRGVLFPFAGGEFGSGNNMAFSRNLLTRLGGFDESLGAGSPTRGGEDLDIFRTVLRAGWIIAYTPDAVVHHFHRDTERALRTQLYGYGTGMAAVVTKAIVSDPAVARELIGRLPAALRVLLSPRSAKNAGKGSDYPMSLTAIELLGYLTGPWLWLRSRRAGARSAPADRPVRPSAPLGPAP